MNHDVFISYSSQDTDAAQAICHVLEQNEIRCWMAPRDIPPGSDYGDVIDEAIKSCSVVVVIFSETAASSQWVKGELNIAFEEQKTIIPFRLDQTPLKGQNRVMLNKTHWIDAYPDYKTKFNDLVKAVAHPIGKEVQFEREPVTFSGKIKQFKKPLIIGSTLVALIAAFSFLYPLIAKQMHSFSYDKQGLHVRAKGLTSEQEEALSSILDNMVLIEGGSFTMGNTEDIVDYLTEQDSLSNVPHEVELDNYYINKYEVTQKQWRAFLTTEGRCIAEGDDIPMDKLSWEDAQAFADTLATITGLNFAVPTEAQWEFAAKGGIKSNHYLFSGSDNPTDVGWTSGDDLKFAQDVGGKRHNELGLYDMTGNVSEWCSDHFDLYSAKKEKNPLGPESDTLLNRVLRGGDYTTPNSWDTKTTTRFQDAPFTNRRAAGLRLVIRINSKK